MLQRLAAVEETTERFCRVQGEHTRMLLSMQTEAAKAQLVFSGDIG